MKDAVVVGAGIIGATVAQALRKQGQEVLLLDDAQEKAGTRPSGGHLKPSWLGGMKKVEYEPAMQLLDEVWTLSAEEFVIRPSMGLAKTTVYRADTDVVMQCPKTWGHATDLGLLNNYPLVHYQTRKGEVVEERCRLLVVAAGVWCDSLLPSWFPLGSIKRKQGVSFRFSGKVKPFIKPWAPYKQVVAHQQGPNEIWVGDGSAILEENWTEERTRQCLSRCQGGLGENGYFHVKTLTGLRPYCTTPSSDPCLLAKLGPRAWVATGAGKSGTISGGWVARRIIDATN